MQQAQPSGDPVDRAVAAYVRANGSMAPIPASDSEVVEVDGREYVVLRNVNGVLAVYLIRPNGRLKGLDVEDWPAGVEDES